MSSLTNDDRKRVGDRVGRRVELLLDLDRACPSPGLPGGHGRGHVGRNGGRASGQPTRSLDHAPDRDRREAIAEVRGFLTHRDPTLPTAGCGWRWSRFWSWIPNKRSPQGNFPRWVKEKESAMRDNTVLQQDGIEDLECNLSTSAVRVGATVQDGAATRADDVPAHHARRADRWTASLVTGSMRPRTPMTRSRGRPSRPWNERAGCSSTGSRLV